MTSSSIYIAAFGFVSIIFLTLRDIRIYGAQSLYLTGKERFVE